MPYTAPTVEDFKRRFPAFDAVPDATVQLYLDEADGLTHAWADAPRARAVLFYAAHHLAMQGMGTGAIPVGVTSFKSGTFSATISDSMAGKTGFAATWYGREYLALARGNFAGPRMAWTPPVV